VNKVYYIIFFFFISLSWIHMSCMLLLVFYLLFLIDRV
jgi:hypothetical protein